MAPTNQRPAPVGDRPLKALLGGIEQHEAYSPPVVAARITARRLLEIEVAHG